jgi:NAD(P)-dependent dehydrogenase (short-subunit alcohol dehydrogenase family)
MERQRRVIMELSKFALTDKTAMVTGACGRMGKEITLAFADAGAHLAVVDQRSEVEAVADQVRAKGRRSLAFCADLTKKEQVNNVVDKVAKTLGRIDILVNATGEDEDEPPLLELPEEEFDRIFTVNLKPILLCSQAVARVMVKQKKGVIININAAGWGTRVPWKILLRMNAYKVASVGNQWLTEAMAAQWGPYGIRVNCICPRFIEAPGADEKMLPKYRRGAARAENLKMVPLGRFGLTEDVAYAVVYLASDAAAFVNGEQLHVDGGPNLF